MASWNSSVLFYNSEDSDSNVNEELPHSITISDDVIIVAGQFDIIRVTKKAS